MKQRVIFAFPRWRRNQGSVVPRVQQNATLLAEVYSDTYEVETVALAKPRFTEQHEEFVRHAKGAVVIGLQTSLRLLGRDRMIALRETSAGMCSDHVDSVPETDELGIYHAHILASRVGCRRVNTRLAKEGVSGSSVVHVTHHADPRITLVSAASRSDFRIGYLGNPRKMIAPPDPRAVQVLTYKDQSDYTKALQQMTDYPMHYGVRPRSASREVSKPFTKGFFAAAMGANILVNRQTDDAEFYLGTDYPYLIKSFRARNIAEGIETARAGYGGAEWRRGLEVMEHVRQLSTPNFAIRELAEAIKTALAIADQN